MTDLPDSDVANMIKGKAILVLLEMDDYYIRPKKYLAEHAGVSQRAVADAMRLFKHFGMVNYSPSFSEDDGLLMGSGYFLNAKGTRIRDLVRKRIHGEGEQNAGT